jgi:hypothetical protein
LDRGLIPRCEFRVGAPACHIVHGRNPAYLMGRPVLQANGASMSDSTTTLPPGSWRPLAIVAAASGLLLAGTVALWAHYGTAVFYEMIVAGLVACF